MATSPQNQEAKRPPLLADDGELPVGQPVLVLDAMLAEKARRAKARAPRYTALWPLGMAVGLFIVVYLVIFTNVVKNHITNADQSPVIIVAYLFCFGVIFVTTGRYLVRRFNLDRITERSALEIVIRFVIVTTILTVVMLFTAAVMYFSWAILAFAFFGSD